MTVKDAWKWIGRHLLIYGFALAAYYAIWKGVMAVTGIRANDYQGISTAGQITIGTIISGGIQSVKNLFFFFLEWNIFEHPITLYAILNMVFLAAFAVVLVLALKKSGALQQPAKLATILFAMAATIPMISLLCFISGEVGYRPMMLHSVAIWYLFAIQLFDRWTAPKISTLFGVFVAVMIFNFAVMANIAYSALDACYEKSYYIGSQMMERISEIQEQETIDSIYFVGDQRDAVTIDNDLPYSRAHILTALIEDNLLYDQEHSYFYLSNYFDLRLSVPDDEVCCKLIDSVAVAEMGIWPASDSVAVIDDVLVIKLANETIQ